MDAKSPAPPFICIPATKSFGAHNSFSASPVPQFFLARLFTSTVCLARFIDGSLQEKLLLPTAPTSPRQALAYAK